MRDDDTRELQLNSQQLTETGIGMYKFGLEVEFLIPDPGRCETTADQLPLMGNDEYSTLGWLFTGEETEFG